MYLMQAEIQTATSNDALLWLNGEVYYNFDNSVTPSLQDIIRGAMDEYEQHTCLKFVLRPPTSLSRVFNFDTSFLKCHSNSFGNDNTQRINHESQACCDTQNRHAALNKIGRAIGLWNEQSRPDRDNYITINWDNIKIGEEYNFRLFHAVDYQGEKYDYASVMHHGLRESSSNGQPTMAVKNLTRYREQGSPTIGNKLYLSAGDIRLVNKLYKCYNPQGYGGRLHNTVTKVTGLPKGGKYMIEILSIGKLNNRPYSSVYRSGYYGTYDVVNTTEVDYYNEFSLTGYAQWRYFDIRIHVKNRAWEDVIGRQTIWIEQSSGEVADSYCVEEWGNRMICFYYIYEIRH